MAEPYRRFNPLQPHPVYNPRNPTVIRDEHFVLPEDQVHRPTRDGYNDDNAIITAEEFNPDLLSYEEMRHQRIGNTREAMNRLDTIYKTTYRPVEALDGMLTIYNVNLKDENFAVLNPFMPEGVADPGVLDLASLTSYVARRVQYRNLGDQAGIHQVYGQHLHSARTLPRGIHRTGANLNNMRNFINHPLTGSERATPIRMSINWFAPIGVQRTTRGGDFEYFIGTDNQMGFRGAAGRKTLPADAPHNIPLPDELDGQIVAQLDTEFMPVKPYRHQYSTFAESIQMTENHSNTNNRMFAAIWRDTTQQLNLTMGRESIQDPFTCGRIQIIVVRELAGGVLGGASGSKTASFHSHDEWKNLAGNKHEIHGEIFGYKVWSAPSRGNNCFFYALKAVRKRYSNKDTQGKKMSEVKVKVLGVIPNLDCKVSDFKLIRMQGNLAQGVCVGVNDTKVLQAAADFFKIDFDILVLDEDISLSIVKRVRTEEPVIECRLLLHDNHFFIMKDLMTVPLRKYCTLCGRRYMYVHNCKTDRWAYKAYVLDKRKHTIRNISKRKKFLLREKYKHEQMIKEKRFGGYNVQKKYDEYQEAIFANPGCSTKLKFQWDTMDKDKMLLYFDFETYSLGENGAHKVYAVGYYYDGEYHEIFAGDSTLEKFIDVLDKLEPVKSEYPVTKKRTGLCVQPIKLIAWNGASFDFRFLVEYLTRNPRKSLHPSQIVMNNNKILSVNFGTFKEKPKLQTWDPIRFISTSLATACADFKVKNNSKEIFPHKMITNENAINNFYSLEELNCEENYFDGDAKKVKDEPWTVEKMNDIGIKNVNGKYSLKDVAKYYLKKDVLGMREIVLLFGNAVHDGFQANMTKYVTMPSMSKDLWMVHNKKCGDIWLPKSEKHYNAMCGAVYGGHVDVIKSRFKADGLDLTALLKDSEIHDVGNNYEIKSHGLKFDDFKDKTMQEVDYTSLYVSAMYANDFPIGQPSDMTELQIKHFNDYLQRKAAKQDVFMIVKIKYKPNPWLITPILPSRGMGLGLEWNLEPGEGWYTCIDIAMALECHYEMEAIEGICWERKYPIYKDWMKKTYDMKAKGNAEKNPAMKAAGKLAGNACYGVMLQADIMEDFKFVKTKKELSEFLVDHDIGGAFISGVGKDKLTGIYGKKLNVEHKSPKHLGAFILAYARLLMHEQLKYLNPIILKSPSEMSWELCRQSMKDSYYYTDTDSFWINSNLIDRFPILGEELGMLKDEAIKGGYVIARWNPGPKEYCNIMIKPDNTVTCSIKSKGISISHHRLIYFLKAMHDEIYVKKYGLPMDRGTQIVVPNRIKVHGYKSHDNPFQVQNTTLMRTFHATPFTHRVKVNTNMEKEDEGEWSLPYGHILVLGETKLRKKCRMENRINFWEKDKDDGNVVNIIDDDDDEEMKHHEGFIKWLEEGKPLPDGSYFEAQCEEMMTNRISILNGLLKEVGKPKIESPWHESSSSDENISSDDDGEETELEFEKEVLTDTDTDIGDWEETWEKMKYDNRIPDMPDSLLFVDESDSESEEEEELVVNRKRKRCSWIDDECGVAK
jgi:hypothetical protein